MDIIELRLLLAVAETGSVAAAAKETGYPRRATLQRRLDDLETRAGVQLLKRSPRGTALTSAGQRLADKAEPVINQARTLLRSAAEFVPEGLPPLRMAVSTGIAPIMLMDGYAALRREFADLRFEMRTINAASELSVDHVDVAFHFGEMPEDERWVTGHLMQLRELLLASPNYLDERGRPTGIDELADHDLIGWVNPDAPPYEWPTIDGACFPVEPNLVHSDVHLVRHLAASGQGIALVPEADVDDPEVSGDKLEAVLPDLVGRVVPVSYAVPKMLSDAPRIALILRAMRAFSAAI
ncbi:MAG: LysR family transcriptional regulator [Myxococcota bacterium]